MDSKRCFIAVAKAPINVNRKMHCEERNYKSPFWED